MSQEDILKSRIEKLKNILVASKTIGNFFGAEIMRLDDIFRRIDNHQTQIAIIGITSSGKSTLMNAILGSRMLPTGVAPTSGKQVICSWDKTQHAVIVFDPAANKKPLDITIDIEKKLRQYGDEKFNPQNKEQVYEIQVFSPSFRFGHNFVFVDTPGLDAHELEEHERITMQLVLPTVDMVMYLTTVKTSSDAKNLEFMEQVMSKTKPLVIVQNMIDSIEPKISSRGSGPDKIEKTKDEVRCEHYERVRKLLDKSQNDAVKSAPIVQVSAIAKDWKESNLENLGKVLLEQQNNNSGIRLPLFEQQLKDLISDMLDKLSLLLANEEEAEKIRQKKSKQIKEWEAHLTALKSAISQMGSVMSQKAQNLGNNCEVLLSQINKKYGLLLSDEPKVNDNKKLGIASFFAGLMTKTFHSIAGDYSKPEHLDESIKRKKNEFVSEIKALSTCFSEQISLTQKALDVCCQDFGIDKTRILQRTVFNSFSPVIPDFEEIRVVHHDAKRTKQSGIWGGFKRVVTLGHCGYDEEEAWDENVSEYNVEKLVASIKSEYQKEVDFISQNYPAYETEINRATNIVSSEFDKRNSSLQKPQENTIPLEDVKTVITFLKQMTNDVEPSEKTLSKSNRTSPNNSQRDKASLFVNTTTSADTFENKEKLINAKYGQHLYQTYVLANELSLDCNREYMQHLIKRSCKKKVVVAGWTMERLQYFRDVFFRSDDNIQLLDFTSNTKISADNSVLLILLVNAAQSGYAEKMILGNEQIRNYIYSVCKNGNVIWTMDSVREHIFMDERDSFVESYCELLRIAEKIQGGKPIFDTMTCEREFYYTVLVHELLKWDGTTQNEKQEFVNDFAKMFKLDVERREKTGKYLNQYISMRSVLQHG